MQPTSDKSTEDLVSARTDVARGELPDSTAAVQRIYAAHLDRIERELRELSVSFARIGGARLVVGLAMIAGLGAIVWSSVGDAGWFGEAAGLVAFVTLVVLHARIVQKQQRLEAAAGFYRRGQARLIADWGIAMHPVDPKVASPSHPYAADLDIVGERSLMAMLDETVTPWGRRDLARALLGADRAEPFERRGPEEIQRLQHAVRDLASRPAFREAWIAEGRSLELPEAPIAAFVRWATEKTPLVPSVVTRIAAKLIPPTTIASFTLYQLGLLPWWPCVVSLTTGVFISFGNRRGLQAILAGAISLGACRQLLRRIEEQTFGAPLLVELARAMAPRGLRASQHLDALSRIAGFLEAQNHAVFRLFISPVLLWELNGAIALDAWRKRSQGGAETESAIAAWPHTLGAIDALSCFAAFAYEHPAYATPEVVATPMFEARDLGHPLLRENARVTNDVTLHERGRALLITGSNMSGKSTLLRAVGINAVLAYAGAPVCARSLRIGPMQIGTSLRVEDSLADGYSHFYAELKRLRQVVDLASTGPVLFLLDEILHGTNARERIIGAKAVVRSLVTRGALGIVSTHDTQIAALEQETNGSVVNMHFIESVEGEAMTFDYRLREGVVTSGNALRLMKALGLEVDL